MRVVNVRADDLEPGDWIRVSVWPPHRGGKIVAVTENDDASLRIDYVRNDWLPDEVESIDCPVDTLIGVESLARFGGVDDLRRQVADLTAERDQALGMVDHAVGCPDGCDCQTEDRPVADVVVLSGVV